MAESPLANVEMKLADSVDSAFALLRWLGERHGDGGISADTETTGLGSPYSGRLRLVQFGDTQTGWAVPWELWGGVAKEVFERWDGRIAYHNAPFDIKWLSVHVPGFEPRWDSVDDTMTMAHLHDPTSPRALKAYADKNIDPRASAGQQVLDDGMKKQGWTFATVPADWPPYWVYGALDPVLTAIASEQLSPEIKTEFAYPYDIEMAANRICTNMMLKGVLVDVPYVQKAITGIRAWEGEARTWLKANYDISSPNSGGQIARVWERLGVPILFWTDNQAPQFTKEALEFYASMFPQVTALAQTIRAVRQAGKTVGTYLENFLAGRDANDRIHPSLWVAGAQTSRMSCSDPNLQNLTRDDKHVRGSFIAEEGYVLASVDADQIEMRMIADFSADQGLIDAFLAADRGGPDFFTIVTSELFRQKVEKKDPRRQRVKNMMYAKGYGASTGKMAITAGVPVDVMTEMHTSLNARYPGIQRFMDSCIEYGRANRFNGKPSIRTPTGRRLTCRPGEEYVLANRLVQGHAAEALKIAAAKADAAGYGEYMLLPVHDELLFSFPRDKAAEMLKDVSEILTDRETYAVPLTWSGDLMPTRWEKM